MTKHVIRFSGNERLSERLSWRLFGRLRRKRIGRLKAVREVRERGFVTSAPIAPLSITDSKSVFFSLIGTVSALL